MRIKHSIALVLFAALCLFLPIPLAAAAPGNSDDLISLQILSVNDFHGALTENGKNPGAAALVGYLQSAKANNPGGTLILSAGDMFQGTADSNLLYGKTVVEVMNAAGFDAMTLGNHEFDWGLTVLKERIQQAAFPVVCANLWDKQSGKPVSFVKPYAIVKKNGLHIAIIGLATPETAYQSNPALVAPFRFADPVQTVKQLLPELKQKNIDVIIVLSHLASFMDEHTQQISGDAAILAEKAPGIHAIISGHSHQKVMGMVNGIPVVQAQYSGRAVGKIDLVYQRSSQKVVMASSSVVPLPYKDIVPAPTVQAIVEQAQKEIAPVKNQVLGRTIHELAHDRMAKYQTILGQWSTDVLRQQAKTDIAFQNAGGLRVPVQAGVITMGQLYEVMPFDNTLYTLELTGSQIRELLEQGLRNPRIGMLQFSGLQVTIDGPRIVEITLTDGRPLADTQYYSIATNDFLASGGDEFTLFKTGSKQLNTYLPVRDILANAIKQNGAINFSGDTRLRQNIALPEAS